MCEAPRLLTGTSSALREVMTRWLELDVSRQPFDPAAAAALIARMPEPCAGAVAHMLALSTRDTSAQRDLQTGRASANTTLIAGTEIDASAPVVKNVKLAIGFGKRVLQVIVRSTVASPLANAQVVVLPGTVASSNVLALNEQLRSGNVRAARQLEGEQAPKNVLAKLEPGDMYATVRDVPDGEASACAIGLPDQLDEALARQLRGHMDKVEVRCVPVDPDQNVVVVEVPPFPRLD